MMNGLIGFAQEQQVAPEQILSIRILRGESYQMIQELNRGRNLAGLSLQLSQQVKNVGVVRLEMVSGAELQASFVAAVGLEEDPAQMVMSDGKSGIKANCFGELLQGSGQVKALGCEGDAQVRVGNRGVRSKVRDSL